MHALLVDVVELFKEEGGKKVIREC